MKQRSGVFVKIKNKLWGAFFFVFFFGGGVGGGGSEVNEELKFL